MALHIEMATPAVLPLAFAKMAIDGVEKPVMLGVTVQHPPTQIFVQESSELSAYGPRAHVLSDYATTWLKNNDGATSAEFRIESTVPSLVGFSSDAVLALSTAKALAWVNQQNHEDLKANTSSVGLTADDALTAHGFANGGILLVEMEASASGELPEMLRRHEIKHKENRAWAFVYHYPRVPEGLSESYEADRYAMVKQAAALISAESGALITDKIWPAIENDDINAFAEGLKELKAMNESALALVDGWSAISAEAITKAIRVMDENDSLFTSEALTGLSVFSLVHGSGPSQRMRKDLLKQLGYFAGQYAATITDNRGAVIKEFAEDLHLHDYPLPNLIEGITGEGRQN